MNWGSGVNQSENGLGANLFYAKDPATMGSMNPLELLTNFIKKKQPMRDMTPDYQPWTSQQPMTQQQQRLNMYIQQAQSQQPNFNIPQGKMSPNGQIMPRGLLG